MKMHILDKMIYDQIQRAENNDIALQELIAIHGYVSERDRAEFAIKIIKTQFPEEDEAQLMLAVISTAIRDLFSSVDRQITAAKYLMGNIPHAMICGVEPNWVRNKLRHAHVYVKARIISNTGR